MCSGQEVNFTHTHTHRKTWFPQSSSYRLIHLLTPTHSLSLSPALVLSGFTGLDCEHNIDDFVQHACENGGKCMDGVNTYNCHCDKHWTGTTHILSTTQRDTTLDSTATVHNTIQDYATLHKTELKMNTLLHNTTQCCTMLLKICSCQDRKSVV